jgi:hypothetical protein
LWLFLILDPLPPIAFDTSIEDFPWTLLILRDGWFINATSPAILLLDVDRGTPIGSCRRLGRVRHQQRSTVEELIQIYVL